ncbi:MAG TPA: hypothetical protein VKQ32_22810 [Polyangia bacterium]|nr:hypothetical protein [Polyangia bacterium]
MRLRWAATLGLILGVSSAASCRSSLPVSDSPSPDGAQSTDAPALTSCGDGTVSGTGSTADGPFVATAIVVSGQVCVPTPTVQFMIAGNGASTPAISFSLFAQTLDGGTAIRLLMGTQTVHAGISGRQGAATVTITSTADAPETAPDGGPVSHVEGSFTVLDGTATLDGTFSSPFCGVAPCPPTGA